MAAIGLIINFNQKKAWNLKWWEWFLLTGGVIYSVFVLEVIVGFLGEEALQAALVNGGITGIIAIIFWVLMARFVLKPKM